MKKWPKIFRNKYVITLLLFIVWMAFFDGNSLRRQFNLFKEVKNLQATVNEKKKTNEEIKRAISMLKESDETRERFAREEYRFKKDNEEIFVIVADE